MATSLLLASSHGSRAHSGGWYDRLAWISLCGIVVGALYPRLPAVTHLAAGLGLTLLAIRAIGRRLPGPAGRNAVAPLVADRTLRACALLFAASAIASTLVPHLTPHHDPEGLRASLHALWNTLCAATAAGLTLHLLRDDARRAAFLLLFCLILVVVLAGIPVQKLLCGGLDARLSGTKGGANRWSILLLLSAFPVWAALLDRSVLASGLPGWFRLAGWGAALACPPLLQRQSLLAAFAAGDFTSLSSASYTLALTVLIGIVFAHLLSGPPRQRQVALLGIILLLTANLVMGMSRGALFAFILTVLGLLLPRWREAARWIRRPSRCLFMASALLLGAAIFGPNAYVAAQRYRPGEVLRSGQVRWMIWRAAILTLQEHPFLGCGYGQESFRAHWPFRPPYPSEFELPPSLQRFDHAHNLWLHLLATRGIVGWTAFMALWTAALMALLRLRSGQPEGLPFPARTLPEDGSDSPGATDFRPCALVGISALCTLQIVGVLELPLQECNEILAALAVSLGFPPAQPAANALPGDNPRRMDPT